MTNIFDRVILYFRSSYAELKKVSWPSRKDTVRYSTVIIVVCIVVAAFFALLDNELRVGIEAIIAQKHVTPAATTETQTPPVTTPPSVDVQATTPQGQPASVKVTPVPVNEPTKK